MNNEGNLKRLEEKIGYQFKDKKLLKNAMTHSSFSNEQKLKRTENNERLEFLGDAVLELISSEYLYKRYPNLPEGDLTRMRASMVCEPALAACARDIQLGDVLFLGKGEEMTGGRERDSLTSDGMEALIGAVYLDGGFANAKEFVEGHILQDAEKKQLFFDSKTILQEIVQGNYEGDVSYELIGEEGPDHNKRFLVAVKVGEQVLGEGSGKSKKAAEQQAAYEAILTLRQIGVSEDRSK